MQFSRQLESVIAKIFGYMAIGNVPCDKRRSHFQKWPPPAVVLVPLIWYKTNYSCIIIDIFGIIYQCQ